MDTIKLLNERAASYGALRKSSLTAVAMDCAAVELAAANAQIEELTTTLAARDAELAAVKAENARLEAEVQRYKPAWWAFDRRMSWMQGHPALPPRYLGWHIADVASDLIGRAYPEFSEAITRAALTERQP